jgi:hypothetical protein
MDSLEKTLLEKLAEVEHQQWSHWVQYEHSRNLYISRKQELAKWIRQSETPYDKLSETEKESDREWARKVLAIFHEELGKVAQQIRLDKKRNIDKRWNKFKQTNHALKRKMRDVEFYAFNVGYELAKKEDVGLLVEEEGEKP